MVGSVRFAHRQRNATTIALIGLEIIVIRSGQLIVILHSWTGYLLVVGLRWTERRLAALTPAGRRPCRRRGCSAGWVPSARPLMPTLGDDPG